MTRARWICWPLGALVAVAGPYFAFGGVYLFVLGGNWYFAPAGVN